MAEPSRGAGEGRFAPIRSEMAGAANVLGRFTVPGRFADAFRAQPKRSGPVDLTRARDVGGGRRRSAGWFARPERWRLLMNPFSYSRVDS